jgi:hypothetical protein
MPLLPVPPPELVPVHMPKRSWVPFHIQGSVASTSTSENRDSSHTASPEPKPVMPCGETHATTLMMASDVGGPEDGEGGAHAEATVPPAPPLLPAQFWPPGFPAYKMVQDRD